MLSLVMHVSYIVVLRHLLITTVAVLGTNECWGILHGEI